MVSSCLLKCFALATGGEPFPLLIALSYFSCGHLAAVDSWCQADIFRSSDFLVTRNKSTHCVPISANAISATPHVHVFWVLFKESNMQNLTLQKKDTLKVAIHICSDRSAGHRFRCIRSFQKCFLGK